jgi:hypothetical protein
MDMLLPVDSIPCVEAEQCSAIGEQHQCGVGVHAFRFHWSVSTGHRFHWSVILSELELQGSPRLALRATEMPLPQFSPSVHDPLPSPCGPGMSGPHDFV